MCGVPHVCTLARPYRDCDATNAHVNITDHHRDVVASRGRLDLICLGPDSGPCLHNILLTSVALKGQVGILA